MTIPDDELIIAFRDGNEIAFITLYNRYKHAIYNFCLKMLADSEATKDAVQCIFLKIYERRDQLKVPLSFRSWLFTIARNECISVFRKNKNFSPLNDNIGEVDPLTPESSIDRDSEIALVNDAINRLDFELREVILLREYENLSYREISDIIGVPEKTVKSRLFRARKMIYEILKPLLSERN